MGATAPARNGRARGARVPAPALEPEKAEGSQLAAAVLRVQGAAPKLIRNAVGQIQSRTYRYPTNDQVVDVVLPLLVNEDLLWRTFPTTTEDGQPGLRYRMTHVPSGESDEDVMKLACILDPQGQGSGITYARRYALTAYLNLTVDPDDDGASATPATPVDRYAEAEAAATESGSTVPAGSQPTAEPAKPTERRANAKQRAMLEARARAAKLTAGEFANVMLEAAGDAPREWRNEEHAEQTLKRLLDHLPARLVTATKEGIGEGS